MLAGFTNSDAFFIVNRLSNDENLRKVITDRASGISLNQNVANDTAIANSNAAAPLDQTVVASPSPNLIAPTATNPFEGVKRQTDAALKDLSLPIGWKSENLVRQFDCSPETINTNDHVCKTFSSQPGSVNLSTIFQLVVAKPIDLLKILFGWIVSGLAIAMGAPFWFDLLGKIMNVRNSGGKPQSAATKETAK